MRLSAVYSLDCLCGIYTGWVEYIYFKMRVKTNIKENKESLKYIYIYIYIYIYKQKEIGRKKNSKEEYET